ncbi:MAG: metal-dependent transcriptional regulator [Dehalococcoidia bacterium]
MPKQVTNVAVDDALTTIYRLGNDEREDVIAIRVAERLGLTPPTISGMLSRLSRAGLIKVDARKRISLTPSGVERAEEMVRRHRLAECLLVDVFRLEWWRGYQEAHLFEHAISAVTEPLLIESLGHPARSPFGYPIPGIAPDVRLSEHRLADMATGDSTRIERVFEEDEELLQFFDEEGLHPGVTVRMRERAPLRDTVSIELDEREVILGMQTARRVWVEEPS